MVRNERVHKMAFLQANIYSDTLGMEVMVDVILPQQTYKKFGSNSVGVTKDVPVLYLLHGMGGNHSVWQRRTSIERYVKDLGIAVIMPSTDLAWYTDTQYDMKYWTFISEELPKICHDFFPQLTTKREKTFAAGLSMGGFGALKLGLLCPEKFAGIAAMSGMLTLVEAKEELFKARDASYWRGIFGPEETWRTSENDFTYQITHYQNEQKSKFFICCGTEDDLLLSSQIVVDLMQKNDFDVTFKTGPGAHEWQFWDTWIQKVLSWMQEMIQQAN